MLERIKTFGEAAKNLILWVIAPLAFVAGFLYFLILGKNTEISSLKIKQSEDAVANTLDKVGEASTNAANSETDYDTARDAYHKQHRDS